MFFFWFATLHLFSLEFPWRDAVLDLPKVKTPGSIGRCVFPDKVDGCFSKRGTHNRSFGVSIGAAVEINDSNGMPHAHKCWHKCRVSWSRDECETFSSPKHGLSQGASDLERIGHCADAFVHHNMYEFKSEHDSDGDHYCCWWTPSSRLLDSFIRGQI